MPEELFLKYNENIKENKIAGRVYETISDYGFRPIRIESEYSPSTKTFLVKYLFSKESFPKISVLEEILNRAGLLNKIEITNFPE